VAEAKAASTDRPFDAREWKPWDDSSESTDDSAFLLRMAAVCEAIRQRRFRIVEACWAKRLRAALEGLTSYKQFRFVELYSLRQFAAHILREPSPYTADLDGILAYQPWVPENRESYEVALKLGNAPTWAIISESGEHLKVTWSRRLVEGLELDVWDKVAITFGLVPPEGLHLPQ